MERKNFEKVTFFHVWFRENHQEKNIEES